MIIEVITRSEEESERCDYKSAMKIMVDGESKFSVSDGEPEDSNIDRNFNDIYNIPELIELAFEAGKRGEIFELVNSESDEI